MGLVRGVGQMKKGVRLGVCSNVHRNQSAVPCACHYSSESQQLVLSRLLLSFYSLVPKGSG